MYSLRSGFNGLEHRVAQSKPSENFIENLLYSGLDNLLILTDVDYEQLENIPICSLYLSLEMEDN